MEEFYNRLVEEYESFPADAIRVLDQGATDGDAYLAPKPSRDEVEHALDQLGAWHARMKAVIAEEAGE